MDHNLWIFLLATSIISYPNHPYLVLSIISADVPAPGVTQDTASDNSIDIVLMRPNGLCEGLSDNPITYVIEVFSDNVLMTTRNVTSTGATTVSDLSSNTSYQVDVQALINVVSQSSPALFNFTTLEGMLYIIIMLLIIMYCIHVLNY